MKLIIYLLLPVILFLMLLEWAYEKILTVVYWFMGTKDTEPEGLGRDKQDDNRSRSRTGQGKELQAPDEKRRAAGGMAAQERAIPKTIPEDRKSAPDPAEEQKPEIFVFVEPTRGKLKPKGRGKRDDKYRGR